MAGTDRGSTVPSARGDETASTSSLAVDAGQLRRALRVIHCLQRERGASGAYYGTASSASAPRQPRISFHDVDSGPAGSAADNESDNNGSVGGGRTRSRAALATARVDTDRALEHMKAYRSGADEADLLHLNWATTAQITLHKIRNMVDGSSDKASKFPSFRRILVSFSTLISSVIHEFILRYTGAVRHVEKGGKKGLGMLSRIHSSENIHTMLQHPTKPKLPHRRSRSDGDQLSELVAPPTIAIGGGGGGGHVKRTPLAHATSDPAMFHFQGHHKPSSFLPRLDPDDVLPMMEHVSLGPSDGGEAGGPPGGAPEPSANHSGAAPSTEFIEENRERVRRLLSLLGLFVQLKESTGVERATLTSLLVFERQDVSLLVNDVVLEVENQRTKLEALHNTIRPGPMRNLVVELVHMSPEMQQVQESILGGFSLDGLKEHFNAGKLWDVMTVYIDKLHSLELLIVEEIEATRVRVGAPPAPNLSIALRTAFAEGRQDTAEDLVRSIESLSPDEVKRRLVSALKVDPSVQSETLNRVSTSKGVDDLLKELCNVPASKEWEIDVYELRFLKRIGQGSAGTTYIADWAGLKVAVKVASITEMGLDGWRKEVQALQKLHHPNIIRLLGSVYHPHPLTFCLVLEYCDAGDLQDALLRVTPRNFFFHVSASIAKGIAYLHNRYIIHRDIKPSNVLLIGDISSGSYQVKVTDFGVATDLNTTRNLTAETGTYRWMSPEVIRHEAYTQTADVYSYGVLLWQLVTREEPFADRGQIEAAMAVSMESKRPPFPSGTPPAISGLIEKAWADNPSLRPSFEEVCELLIEIESKLSADEKRWIEAPLGHHVYSRVYGSNAEANEGVEIKAAELDVPGVRKPPRGRTPPPAKAKGKDGLKRAKKFSLFSRKSSHF